MLRLLAASWATRAESAGNTEVVLFVCVSFTNVQVNVAMMRTSMGRQQARRPEMKQNEAACDQP